MYNLLHFFRIRIRPIRVKRLIGPHKGHQIFCFRQIDDIVGIARQYLYYFYLIATNLKIQHFIRSDFPELNQTVTADYHKLFVLRMVPVLSFRNSRLRDVYRELPPVGSPDNFGKATSVVHIHFQRIAYLLLRLRSAQYRSCLPDAPHRTMRQSIRLPHRQYKPDALLLMDRSLG